MIFKLLNDTDIFAAYGIICEMVDLLKSKGINQYERPYPPIELFKERQSRNENFALYSRNNIQGIVSLMINHIPDGWKNDISEENFIWITALFVPACNKGKNIGKMILEHADKYAKSKNIKSIILDCYYGNGFLEKYYKNFGYESIVKKMVHYPFRSFEAVLMRKRIIA
jgi:GNAT superfamily N-acetyltransferase